MIFQKRAFLFFLLILISLNAEAVFSQMTARPGDSILDPNDPNAQRSPGRGGTQRDANEAPIGIPDRPSSDLGFGVNLWKPWIENVVKPTKLQKKTYEGFLKLDDTGIMRLIPQKNAVVSATQKGDFIPPETAFYSFPNKVHIIGIADLRFVSGLLQTGIARGSFGVLVPVSEADLEKITLETPDVKKLQDISIPKNKKEFELAKNTATIAADVRQGQVYLLRSAIYGRSDILIAMKLAEIEPEGSILVIWKLLYKGKAPSFKG